MLIPQLTRCQSFTPTKIPGAKWPHPVSIARCLGAKYDDPVWYQKNRRLAKDLKVYTAIEAEMLSAEAAAERFSVTVRTIFRIMERCREALGNSETRQDMVLFAA